MKPDTRKPRAKRAGRPPSANPVPAAERMRQMRLRRKAAGLKPIVTWTAENTPIAPYSSHRVREARSLAMHTVIAEKFLRDPKLLEIPRRNLERWRAQWPDSPPTWWKEWNELLSKPTSTLAGLITEMSERAARLRQSSPFAGVLTPLERKRIYEAFRA